MAAPRIDLLDRNHLVTFTRIRAGRLSVIEQHLIEVLAPHLIGVGRTVSDRALECKGVVATLVVRLEVSARLEHAHGSNFLQNAESLEHG